MASPSLRDSWPWLAFGVALLAMLYVLAPILTPFVVGAGFAYLGDPLVDRLERWRVPRTLGVSLVFIALTAAVVLGIGFLVPVLQKQFGLLVVNFPEWLRWLQDTGLARLGIHLPSDLKLDAEGLRRFVAEHWTTARGFASAVWGRLSTSGVALITTVANLLLIPVVTFYLLRDWDRLVAWIRDILPRPWLPRTTQIARETDEVLGGFIRGQLAVMGAQAIYYWLALWIAGVDLALIIGFIIGLISFVPYLGAFIGILIASIAMLVQTQDLFSLVWIALIFGIGQVLESNVLTPLLVGDRIGLHPVAVIFAVMAGGQLYGFIGVLIALPVAAVIAVAMRHAKEEWLKSRVYLGSTPPPTSVIDTEPP